ncbi:MAG: ZIP family metal transporter [Mangrovibacterium sp.]
MINYLAAFGSTLFVAAVSFAGVLFLVLKPGRLKKITAWLVSFAAGALLGDAFFHLLPESLEAGGEHHLQGGMILAGLFFFFLLEKLILWQQQRKAELSVSGAAVSSVGYMSLTADGFHNFMDGLLIGASFMVDPYTGLTTTLVIALHEIPQEIGDFGILIHSGFSRKQALFFNFLSACTALLGTAVALFFGHITDGFSQQVIPFIAGGFIYLAGSDLIPELKKDRGTCDSVVQLILMILGAMLLYTFSVLGHNH